MNQIFPDSGEPFFATLIGGLMRGFGKEGQLRLPLGIRDLACQFNATPVAPFFATARTHRSCFMPIGKILFALIMLGLAGCASPGVQVRLLVSSGEKIVVNMPQGTVEGNESKEVKIKAAGFLTNPEKKQGIYAFGFNLFTNSALKSVKVEDVTDSKAVTMVEDNDPKLQGVVWTYTSPPLSPDDKNLGWLHEIDESIRIYCFWITLSDGRQLKIYHVVYYAPFMKAGMRRALGLDA